MLARRVILAILVGCNIDEVTAVHLPRLEQQIGVVDALIAGSASSVEGSSGRKKFAAEIRKHRQSGIRPEAIRAALSKLQCPVVVPASADGGFPSRSGAVCQRPAPIPSSADRHRVPFDEPRTAGGLRLGCAVVVSGRKQAEPRPGGPGCPDAVAAPGDFLMKMSVDTVRMSIALEYSRSSTLPPTEGNPIKSV